MKLHAGAVLEQTLRLVRPLAEGGMGSVWVAHHLVLGRDVAVKVLAKPWADMPGAPARFLREAKITALVDSPHVVRVLDCRLTQGDEPLMVLELLHGETLETRIRRRGPMSVFELAEVLEQIGKALSATHAAGFVHRDVKPENVFLEAGPRTSVKLLDFGVARPNDESEWIDADRLPAGTPQYMSPEQMFFPESADGRSDLFALGAVAYFALTGRPPFAADSLQGLYFAAHDATFERPSTVRSELPAALDRFFERALAREPETRFPDARAMAEAFRVAVQPSANAALPSAEASREEASVASVPVVPLTPRRPRQAAMALGLLAIAAVVVLRTVPDLKSANASPPAETTLTSAVLETTTPSDTAEAPRARAVLAPTPIAQGKSAAALPPAEELATPATPDPLDEP